MFVWLLIIVLLGSVLYLNRVGLPDFIKRPLVEQLRAAGVALEFGRLRWEWDEGFVAHNVSFGVVDDPTVPQLFADRVQIRLNYSALLRARVRVESLGIHQGRLRWLPGLTNAPLRALAVDAIRARLRFLPGDQWQLENLRARFAGADFYVTASITNASAIPEWPFLAGEAAATTATSWPGRLQRLADTLEAISFAEPPELALTVAGDARDLQSFTVQLKVKAAAADTPWGQAQQVDLMVRLFPATSNEVARVMREGDGQEVARAEAELSAATAESRTAGVTNLVAQVRLVARSAATVAPSMRAHPLPGAGPASAQSQPGAAPSHRVDSNLVVRSTGTTPMAAWPLPSSNVWSQVEINLTTGSAQSYGVSITNLAAQARLVARATAGFEFGIFAPVGGESNVVTEAAVTARAAGGATPWATVAPAQLKARWVQTMTNPVPLSGQVDLASDSVVTPWARGRGVEFSGSLDPGGVVAGFSDAQRVALGWWTNVLPYQLSFITAAQAVQAQGLTAQGVRGAGRWAAPALVVSNVTAQSYGGELHASAQLDVFSRQAGFALDSSFDLKVLAAVVPAAARDWLRELSWSEPPRLRCVGAVTFPEWTQPPSAWAGAVLPTLEMAGAVAVTNGAFEGIYANWLRSDFARSNRVWRLTDFAVGRPEGGLAGEARMDEASEDFWCRFESSLGWSPVRSFLPPEGQEAFDACEFGSPPVVAGELWGNARAGEQLGFRGRMALTNFTFRGLHADAAISRLGYTNRVLSLDAPRLWNGDQFALADGVAADFNQRRVYISNAFGRFEPRRITGAIGPETDEVMTPYHFLSPPTARVNGYAPMGNPHDADLLFEGTTGGFECWRFHVPRVAGRVHWQGDTLTLTNVQADFYGGAATGWARFVFPEEPGTRFGFHVTTTNTDLRKLMDDLVSPTESLDGQLDVNLTITDADTENAQSWNGFGTAQLRDGLIWSIPIFGVLSKPLDAIMPGVGNSRVSSATASYTITNSVIWSDDLEMRSPAMRLQYRGTVDFDGQVQARVTAEPLRGTPVLGPVVNMALWPVTRLLQYKITGTLAEPKPEPVYIPKLLLMPFTPFKTLEELFTPGTLSTNAPAEIKKAGEVTPLR